MILFNFEQLEHLTNPSNTNLNIIGGVIDSVSARKLYLRAKVAPEDLF